MLVEDLYENYFLYSVSSTTQCILGDICVILCSSQKLVCTFCLVLRHTTPILTPLTSNRSQLHLWTFLSQFSILSKLLSDWHVSQNMVTQDP